VTTAQAVKPKTVFNDDLAKAFSAGGSSWGDLPPIVFVEQPKPTPLPEAPKEAPAAEEAKAETPPAVEK
jgi:hypothetical protein